MPHLRPFIELSALLLAMNLIQTFGEIALDDVNAGMDRLARGEAVRQIVRF